MIGIDSSSAPFSRVQSALRRDVFAGQVSATDETAITSALGDIQAQLAGASPTGSDASDATSGTPTSMKDRVGAAIDDEVASGKLTSDQAGELKKAFEQAHAHSAMHGAHGHHGGGSAIAALTGTSSTPAATAGEGQGSDPTATTSAPAPAAPIAAFVAQFRSVIGVNGVYGASGVGNGASPTSLFINSVG